MRKALITGITGQDGSYLSKLLLSKGYKVYGITRSAASINLKNLKFLRIDREVEILSANLLDLSNIIRILDKHNPDEIYNLASQSSVGLSFDQPIGTLEFNIMSTVNLLEAVRLLHLGSRFYQASSSEMFGKVSELPITEETPMHPISPYAVSKASAHWIAVNYREAYGVFSCCGILFNHESVLRGSNFVTKKIINTAVRIAKGSTDKLKLGNVAIKRDWGYAPDYVRAMWLMLQQENPEDYVVATGESHTLTEFIEYTFAYLGLNWENHVVIDKDLYRPSDIDEIYGNPQKAKTILGWEYHLRFEDLIKLLIEEELTTVQEALLAE
ncbi:MAG: GDP-mannose 4,6-dehydratase [Bacillota bacterium]